MMILMLLSHRSCICCALNYCELSQQSAEGVGQPQGLFVAGCQGGHVVGQVGPGQQTAGQVRAGGQCRHGKSPSLKRIQRMKRIKNQTIHLQGNSEMGQFKLHDIAHGGIFKYGLFLCSSCIFTIFTFIF